MQHPETVTLANGVVVNKDDYEMTPGKYGELMAEETSDKGRGVVITEKPPMLAGNPLNPAGQPEGILMTPTVVQKGDKFFVVDDKGEHDARFNAKGYKTDVEAWTEVAKFEVKTVAA